MHMKTEFTEFFPGFRCFILTQNCVLYGNSRKFHNFLYLIILKRIQEQRILKVFYSEAYLYVVKKELSFRENSRK